jgi:hypothetical protein
MESTELKLMSFLGWLHDQTRNEFVKIALGEKLKEYNVPQNSIIGTRIIELGILEKKQDGNSYLYKWKNEEGPTMTMVKNINDAVTAYWRNKPKDLKKSKIDKKAFFETSAKIAKLPKAKEEFSEDIQKELKQVLFGAKEIDKNILEKEIGLQALAINLSFQDIVTICKFKGLHGKLSISIEI